MITLLCQFLFRFALLCFALFCFVALLTFKFKHEQKEEKGRLTTGGKKGEK